MEIWLLRWVQIYVGGPMNIIMLSLIIDFNFIFDFKQSTTWFWIWPLGFEGEKSNLQDYHFWFEGTKMLNWIGVNRLAFFCRDSRPSSIDMVWMSCSWNHFYYCSVLCFNWKYFLYSQIVLVLIAIFFYRSTTRICQRNCIRSIVG